MKNAVVLLSGGLDSATTLALVKSQGWHVHTLSIDYGQRHRRELQQAATIAANFGVTDHRIVQVNLPMIGGSALTADIAVPTGRSITEMAAQIPVTYVPARNTVMLSIALGFAETVRAFDLFIGANSLDYAGYPDCRPEYLRAFEAMANLATKAAIEGQGRYTVHAPYISHTKAEIIRAGIMLGVDYALTMSCYSTDADGRACGECDACILRREGFLEAGIPDPTMYRSRLLLQQ